ncbi:DUF6869 domain-containing protein [Maritimibacter sp. DP1N21-5]|uniref:DUF6869 domain-containing protein n=1 Tax=Maritimibacter sp. DP1N21-5 TaxID=2836867 RepID=UPI001C446747|nr:hypothetical protein [Maritimibacter sp. DP1N21-5]MBV7409472.1 hypothetical protein [Maritimibacter sp. DP1N21-5]
MTQAIPRPLVAKALDQPEDALPSGDLPIDRLAQRFLMFLRDTDEDEDFEGHPEVWTAVLASSLASENPDLSFAVQEALVAEAQAPQDLSLIAAGPMTELFATHGPDLLERIEAATTSPRFAMALGALAPEGHGNSLFWARVQAMAKGHPDMIDDLPES